MRPSHRDSLEEFLLFFAFLAARIRVKGSCLGMSHLLIVTTLTEQAWIGKSTPRRKPVFVPNG